MAVARGARSQAGAAPRRVLRKPAAAKRKAVRSGQRRHRRLKTTPPAAWRADYPIIQRLRKQRDSPVDRVGCERLADPRASRADFEWQCLVAAMLSSQTKDQANAEAMAALHAHGNTAAHIARTPVGRLDKLIAKVGFHSVKARNLRAAAHICIKRHGGHVPRTLEGLLELPGVGPKMAHLTLHAAFDAQQGLCVDTHVHRIANALGWIKTRTPEETRIALEAWLPRRHWPDINVLLVGLGQDQQQEPQKLVERCLSAGKPLAPLRLLSRIGLWLRPGKYERLDALAGRSPEVRRLLARGQ